MEDNTICIFILGRDYVLNDRDIIGIFNLETTTISPRGREFLNYAQKNGAVVSLSDELPQSYVSGGRRPGGYGVSFGAVQRRAAPPRRKDDRVNAVQPPLARTRSLQAWKVPATAFPE